MAFCRGLWVQAGLGAPSRQPIYVNIFIFIFMFHPGLQKNYLRLSGCLGSGGFRAPSRQPNYIYWGAQLFRPRLQKNYWRLSGSLGSGGLWGTKPAAKLKGPIVPNQKRKAKTKTLQPCNPGTLKPYNPPTLKLSKPQRLKNSNPGKIQRLESWNP